MTSREHDDLVTDEGVDEASRASTVEGPDSGSDDVVGPAPVGDPVREEDPHGPAALETADVTAARRSAPGQELDAGEG